MIHSKIKGRRASRFFAVQAVYQHEHAQKPISSLIQEFIQHRITNNDDADIVSPNLSFFQQIVTAVTDHKQSINDHLNTILDDDWKIERIEAVMRAIFQCACYEMFYDKTVPFPVIINEYIEVAKQFFSQSEVNFVNVILDKLSKSNPDSDEKRNS